jgi:hypothetical protein
MTTRDVFACLVSRARFVTDDVADVVLFLFCMEVIDEYSWRLPAYEFDGDPRLSPSIRLEKCPNHM